MMPTKLQKAPPPFLRQGLKSVEYAFRIPSWQGTPLNLEVTDKNQTLCTPEFPQVYVPAVDSLHCGPVLPVAMFSEPLLSGVTQCPVFLIPAHPTINQTCGCDVECMNSTMLSMFVDSRASVQNDSSAGDLHTRSNFSGVHFQREETFLQHRLWTRTTNQIPRLGWAAFPFDAVM